MNPGKPETTAEPLRVAIYQLGTMDPDKNADYEVLHDLIEYTERACADLDAAREQFRAYREAAEREIAEADWPEISLGQACATLIQDAEENAPEERGWAIRSHWAYLPHGEYDVCVRKLPPEGESVDSTLKKVRADLDAARERIDLYEWAVGRGVRVILKRDGSHSGMIRFSWFDQHDNAQHEYVRELWSGLRDLRERLQR